MLNLRDMAVVIAVGFGIAVPLRTTVAAEQKVEKIAIVKADDVRSADAKWKRFIELSIEKKVKVSLGIICESLANPAAEYKAWLLAQKAGGMVEFWNHGWDHKQSTEGAKKVMWHNPPDCVFAWPLAGGMRHGGWSCVLAEDGARSPGNRQKRR